MSLLLEPQVLSGVVSSLDGALFDLARASCRTHCCSTTGHPGDLADMIHTHPTCPAVVRGIEVYRRHRPHENATALSDEDAAQLRTLAASADSMLAAGRTSRRDAVRAVVRVALALRADPASYGGGSIGSDLGVVWLRPSPAWTSLDLAECLLHEAVHQSVFAFDLAIGLLGDAAYDPDLRAPSAVRSVYPGDDNVERPYWASFHAVLVALELGAWYRDLGDRTSAARFLEPAQDALATFRAPHAPLTPAGRHLLEQCAAGQTSGV